MSQVWLAADGPTRTQLSSALGVTDDSFLASYQSAIGSLTSGSTSSNVTCDVFNGLYLRDGFSVKANYSAVLSTYYSSSVSTFSGPADAAQAINAAVAATTNNLIPRLVDAEALTDAVFVLVSALYFKGNWKEEFYADSTRPAQFLTVSGNKTVDMMHMEMRVPYVDKASYDVISLPYTDSNYKMVLLRPAARTMASVQSLVNSLNTLDVANILSQLQETRLYVAMPRFKLETEYSLLSALQALGIQHLFSGTADLGNMADSQLLVNKVFHKVVIEVDEKGTEAAGAGGVAGITSVPPSFTLDRPFVAIVWNSLHSVNMFTAYVASPAS
ncbi:leukocyte elastase inhibitor-like [Amphibalanus amphitrite]|uniref:leukocyte elastase inhibitor-like n=1 Tax=Amphibalanus amphitrite TaxID=1232801 RepID=UPI001C9021E8|nr:leukocyte elastase inhibitor-like [Amphibalanus amphitrite]